MRERPHQGGNMKLLIKSGRVINPDNNQDEISDLLIEDGIIIKNALGIEDTQAVVFDAAGSFVMPGFIDLHVHLREPGLEYKETIKTGAKAAAKGGFTTICAMPNTKPVIDNAEQIRWVKEKSKEDAIINVYQIGAVTKAQKGQELADIIDMADAGAIGISEDGKSVMNAQLYKEAMKLAAAKKLPVFAHCEDIALVNKGVMNAGKRADELNLPGISNAVEDVIVARDILLAKETKVQLHLCHCSTKDSVTMVEMAKKDRLPVTAEVCPHHFVLSDEDIVDGDSNYKMNPPLRSKEDVAALIEGLKNDIIDVIATDHAPHHADEKAKSMQEAPFGIVGLETALALTYTELVETGVLTPMQMAEKLSFNPAKVIAIPRGTLNVGSAADIVIWNPEIEYDINPKEFASLGKNTPFGGRKVKGKVVATIVNGAIVYKMEEEHDK